MRKSRYVRLASTMLRVLRNARIPLFLCMGKNRFYSLSRDRPLKLVEFFEHIYDYNLKSLKEYVEGKGKNKKKIGS
ncbi:MAG: hypothetical protein WBE34_05655 [Candidatus Nitrosopolaris sp.]